MESGETGYTYDYYRIQGRMAPNEAEVFCYGVAIVYTLGLYDIYAFPASLIMVPRDSRREHDLWVYYRSDDTYFTHDSDSWPFRIRRSPHYE